MAVDPDSAASENAEQLRQRSLSLRIALAFTVALTVLGALAWVAGMPPYPLAVAGLAGLWAGWTFWVIRRDRSRC